MNARFEYEVIHGVGELRYYSKGEGHIVFIIGGAKDGYLTIGNVIASIKDGCACVRISALRDGEYSPKCLIDGATVSLGRIRKSGRGAEPVGFLEDNLPRLLLRMKDVEERLDKLEGELTEIHKAIGEKITL